MLLQMFALATTTSVQCVMKDVDGFFSSVNTFFAFKNEHGRLFQINFFFYKLGKFSMLGCADLTKILYITT